MTVSIEFLFGGAEKGDYIAGLRFPCMLVKLQFSCVSLHIKSIVINKNDFNIDLRCSRVLND